MSYRLSIPYVFVAMSCAASAPQLRPTIDAHLAAIASRNLVALLPTITSGEDLSMIAPDGFRFTTRQQYVDFHQQWFASKDHGQLQPEVVHVVESPTLGHALVRYRYRSTDPAGTEHEVVSWLALTFALEGGSWRLVFDQNTVIQKPATTK